MPKHITKEKKEEIVKCYKQAPITIEKMAETFNISCPSVIKILNEYKIKRYSKATLFSPNLKKRYFQNIDTESKAYFLGLLLTDGCVFKNGNKETIVSLVLQEKDKYLIEHFLKEIKSNKKITSDGRGCSEINICCTEMGEDLAKYGVVPRKSLISQFPTNIPQEHMCHLVRGIIDGDGSVSYYARQNRKCHTKAIRLCSGNRYFLESIVEFFDKVLDVEKVNIYREKENLWSIAYRKNESMAKLIRYIYDGATVYMERKKHICDLVLNEILSYGNTEITTCVTTM